MSQRNFKKSLPIIVIMTVFSVVMIALIYSILNPDKKLPVYNPADVNPRLVDSSVKHVRSNHKIGDFSLINQNGKVITQKDYEDKIYVADFFFTRCQTICPIMTNNMIKVQEEFKNDSTIMLLSHSVTPVMDSIPILRDYADMKGVEDSKWNVTTGDKRHIYDLARKSYFAVIDDGDGGEQDFIHTENFILVDKKRQIRGYYDGTNSEDIQQLIADIKLLQEEY
ncbi:SCO family protein [Urechidicola croceus]|uniref:SCO family protein n=1 Tax=Urechidicola croceus TaxID=1850246 RepID=A0A1D8P8N9_9FLAO|nr:SCO family protein [Urechidicola croceus]AOW20919.1 SCO family protein [Urechidicola croceus]